MTYSTVVVSYAWGTVVLCLFAPPYCVAWSFLSRKTRFFKFFRTLFKTRLFRILSFPITCALLRFFPFSRLRTPCQKHRGQTSLHQFVFVGGPGRSPVPGHQSLLSLTPLLPTPTRHSPVSPLIATLTDHPPVSPLVATLTKKRERPPPTGMTSRSSS
jgi:hypothetical protein